MALRSDNGPEFVAMKEELKVQGITLELTTPYTPEQNGVSERLNRTLITTAKAMPFGAKLPLEFWGEAVMTANCLRNRSPIGPRNVSPEEAFTGRKPKIGYLRVFGCKAYALKAPAVRHKLEPNSTIGVFVGYEETTRQDRVYNPERNQIIRSSNVGFKEDECLDWPWDEELEGELMDPIDLDIAPEEPEETVSIGPQGQALIEPRHSEIQAPLQPENLEIQEPTSPEMQVSTIPGSPESSSPRGLIELQSDPESESEPEPEPEPELPTQPTIRRSARTPVPRRFFDEYALVAAGQALSSPGKVPIPGSYDAAITDPQYSQQWRAAIDDELDKLGAM